MERQWGKKVEKFEDLEVWKEGLKLSIDIYKLFKSTRDFAFRDQVQRSAVSIPSNIAEGYERQTNKEFIHFLFIAKGSCGELRSQIHIAKAVGMITKEEAEEIMDKTKKISAMLYKLIEARKQRF